MADETAPHDHGFHAARHSGTAERKIAGDVVGDIDLSF
jgi:hypothetical protein